MDAGLQADYVVPVPDSSNFMAIGYSAESKIPLSFGLIRNHYIGRTFIRPGKEQRDDSLRKKFNVLPNIFRGKRIVLIDDSIVRGGAIRKIVALLQASGVGEIHLRIGSPQVRYGCYYGIDTPSREELVANLYDLEEIRSLIGVKSLKHIDIPGIKSCVKYPENYCYACFNGQYPVLAENETH